MMKFVKEFIFGVDEPGADDSGSIKEEDGGCAEIVSQEFPNERLHFRLISWDERYEESHPEFRKLTGKRVRVTLETVDT